MIEYSDVELVYIYRNNFGDWIVHPNGEAPWDGFRGYAEAMEALKGEHPDVEIVIGYHPKTPMDCRWVEPTRVRYAATLDKDMYRKLFDRVYFPGSATTAAEFDMLFYDPAKLAAITSSGQAHLAQMVEELEKSGAPVSFTSEDDSSGSIEEGKS